MTQTTEQIIRDILRREGSTYTNHPDDLGGPTKYGITLKTLRGYRNDRTLTAEDVARLTQAEAFEIYLEVFVVRPKIDQIPSPRIRALMVDSVVQHPRRTAVRWLQRAVGADADGWIGPQTLQLVSMADNAETYRRVLADRIRYYGRIITDRPKNATFAAGWANRVAEFL